jgi:hypothetical protein
MIFEADASYNPNFTRRYGMDDADEFIRPHVLHWLICIETYRSQSDRLSSLDWGRWVLEYGSEETCVYSSIHENKKIIGFRGTKASKDLYDDLKIAMGSIFPRAVEGVSFVSSILETGAEVELCGHSLGGAIAREVGGRLALPVVTFNAAAPPTAPVLSLFNEVDYHIVFDIISAWQSPNTVRIDKGFRPVPTFWQKLTPITWLHASFADIEKAHKLSNFSNEVYGRVICGEDETRLFNKWLVSLPRSLANFVYVVVFGVSGAFGLPRMEGCYGFHLNST